MPQTLIAKWLMGLVPATHQAGYTWIMAAILELLVALIVAPLMSLIELLIRLLAFIIELCFLGVKFLWLLTTRGRTEATAYLQNHKIEYKGSNNQKLSNNTDPAKSRRTRPEYRFGGWALLLIIASGLIVLLGGLFYERIQNAREQQTRMQLRTLTKHLANSIRENEPGAKDLTTGLLQEKDAWQRPLELFIDRWPVGTLVVVRSAGRDGKTGTEDDLLAVDGVGPAGLPDFLRNTIKRRLGKLLGNIELDKLPINWVFDD